MDINIVIVHGIMVAVLAVPAVPAVGALVLAVVVAVVLAAAEQLEDGKAYGMLCLFNETLIFETEYTEICI